jgi:lipooligosaccharide transport system ATP-binding protein
LGVVSQSDNLDDALSVLQNLRVQGRYYNLDKHTVNQRSQELLDLFDLSHVGEKSIDTLSGGMKRRLVIARALIHQPTILILDEPTTGLDPQVRQLVWQRIRMMKEKGVTVVLSTHYMDEAFQLCDRVAIMDLGSIVAIGTPSFLISKYAGDQIIDINQSAHTPSFQHLVNRLQKMNILFFARSGQSISVTYTGEEMDWIVDLANSAPRPATLEDVFLRLTGREFKN